MLEDTKKRLESIGFPVSNDPSSFDETLLAFAIEKVTNHILVRTNLKEIPDKLTNVAIDMVVGEFLHSKHSTGQLDLSQFNFEAVTKQVQDGDTTVTFAVSDSYSPEALFFSFLERMKHGEVKWSDYRVLTW